MAMLPMKRLQALIPESHRDSLLRSLMALGCLEIIASAPDDADPRLTDRFLPDNTAPSDTQTHLEQVRTALAVMGRFTQAEKRSFLSPLRTVSSQDLENADLIGPIIDTAQFINRISDEIEALHGEEERLVTRKLFLAPWEPLDVPLDTRNLKQVSVLFGVCPAAVDTAVLKEGLFQLAHESELTVVSSDQEQHYLFLLCHQSLEQTVETFLKEAGFSRAAFKDIQGTALSNLQEYDRRIRGLQEKRTDLQNKLQDLKKFQQDLELCFDALTLRAGREEAQRNLLQTARTSLITGWVPENRTDAVARELMLQDCAYAFADPQAHENPPVAFKNTAIAAPFGIISALYGTPRYGSVVDPTPFMAPFFFIFFGMMVSDAAYGLILALGAIWALRQLKRPGFLRQLFTLVLYCGVSTAIWGLLFGSWFGDSIPAISKMLTGTAVFVKPLWFDPLKQPMVMLVFSFALGGLQILAGLGLSGWRQIRSGQWQDALFDVGFWYLLLIGAVLTLLKLPYGPEMAVLGAAGIVLTAGRHENNPIKRVLTGFLSLYNVTGYLADVLSYSRLLALGLASAVIASVINAMGTIGGRSLGGIIALIVIFILGHTFNLAINLVGAYVHASRLQYVEFFSKFYEGGGKPFTPFAMATKYVEVQKRE